jgi:Icc-related predicted phosphoesterase
MRLLGGRGRPKGTRVFFATDVHGSERTWRKFLNAAKFYQADVLVMGGDVMGKLAIPIIRGAGGDRRATIHGRVETLETEGDVAHARDLIGRLGMYDVEMDEDEYRAIQADPERVEGLWRDLAVARLQRWIEIAEERLGPDGIPCYVSGGNDDLLEVMEALPGPDAGTRSFVAAEESPIRLDERHVMVSLPYVNPTPWHTPREAPEDELRAMIDARTQGLDDADHAIFNFHAPPKDSTLDTCAMLDWTTDPPSQIGSAGQPLMYGAGSDAVREAIERFQPKLGLHGHIHESQAAARIGRTLCVNPGSEYGEGVLRGCLITLSEGKDPSYQMTAG